MRLYEKHTQLSLRARRADSNFMCAPIINNTDSWNYHNRKIHKNSLWLHFSAWQTRMVFYLQFYGKIFWFSMWQLHEEKKSISKRRLCFGADIISDSVECVSTENPPNEKKNDSMLYIMDWNAYLIRWIEIWLIDYNSDWK